MCKVWALSCLDRQSKTGKLDIKEVSVNSTRKMGVSWIIMVYWYGFVDLNLHFGPPNIFLMAATDLRLIQQTLETRRVVKCLRVEDSVLWAACMQQICSRLQLIAVRKEFCNKVVFSNVFVAD